MRTIAPAVFVSFKRWMGENARDMSEPKRRRDVRQVDIVERLLRKGLLQTRVPAAVMVRKAQPPNTSAES